MSFINGKWRQKLHIEPPRGWMNDPNGLCFFAGRYHAYFQYSPDSAVGAGDRGWGHYESDDLLHWSFTGFLLRPDIPEDRNGVFSGSAVEHEGRLHIFYTGNVEEEGFDLVTEGRGANVIRVISSDGQHMGEKQVLLRNSDYPPFCSCHVRDPKVWKENGGWRMVLGARTLSDEGCVLYYSSEDLEHWTYDGCESVPDFGFMWECPDRFRLGEHEYLSISPQGILQQEECFQNTYHSGYFRADDGLSDFVEWDHGFDFYAPQTFAAPDGRRIIFGWMGGGDQPYTNPTIGLGWQHCLTLPREILSDDDGQLRQKPVRELASLRSGKSVVTDAAELSLPCELYAQTSGSSFVSIDGGLTLSFSDGLFSMEFTDERLGGGRTVRRARLGECGDIRIILDMSSIEVYLDGGRRVLSTRFYPEGEAVSVRLTGLTAEAYSLTI